MTSAGAPTPAVRPVVAAFDFDGTLTRGGSTFAFLRAVRGFGPVARAVIRSAPRLALAAVTGGAAADRAKESLFHRVLAGLPAAEVERVGAEFATRHLQRRLRPEVRARLDWHRAEGHAVLVVSASPEAYVAPAGAFLGADGVLATRLAASDGRLTGGFEGPNCRGAVKVTRVVAWLEADGLSGPGAGAAELWAYGNSRGDLMLLEAADHGIDVGRLGRWGRLRRFTRLGSLPAPPRPAAPREQRDTAAG